MVILLTVLVLLYYVNKKEHFIIMNTIEVEGLSYGGTKLTTVVIVNNEEIDILSSLFIFERAIQSNALN